MKTVGVMLAATMFALVAARGQGQFVFNSHASPEVDAQIRWGIEPPEFSSFGPGWRIDLFGGPGGTAVAQLVPLDASTDMIAEPPSEWGYVNPILVTVPSVHPGQTATVLLRLKHPTIDEDGSGTLDLPERQSQARSDQPGARSRCAPGYPRFA